MVLSIYMKIQAPSVLLPSIPRLLAAGAPYSKILKSVKAPNAKIDAISMEISILIKNTKQLSLAYPTSFQDGIA